MGRVHDVRSWPEFFEPVRREQKTFELRKNDRGYREGDILLLREWEPKENHYTGRELRRQITYVMNGLGTVGVIEPLKGLSHGYCILGLAREP